MLSTIYFPFLRKHLKVCNLLYASPFFFVDVEGFGIKMVLTESKRRKIWYKIFLLIQACYTYNMFRWVIFGKEPFTRKAQLLGMILAYFGLHSVGWNWGIRNNVSQIWNTMVQWERQFLKGELEIDQV